MEFKEKLRRLELTKTDLAHELGVSRHTISRCPEWVVRYVDLRLEVLEYERAYLSLAEFLAFVRSQA